MTKTNFLKCPKCQEKFSLTKSQKLNLKSSPQCKKCGADIFSYFNKPFAGLVPDAFIHNLDQQMLDAVRKIPGVDSVLKTLLRHSIELSMRLHHQGNFLVVSKNQIKSLHNKLDQAAAILDITNLPELYVYQDPRPNAYTFGVEKYSIAISTGCLDLMTDDEVLCVLAHELGHIKADHVLYKTATRILTSLADNIAQRTFGIGSLVLYPIQLALLRWDRASELSSDRAALLVIKNPTAVLTTLMKLAGATHKSQSELNIKAFIEQAENFEKTKDEGPLGKYIALMNSMFVSHPFPIWRAKEILDWVNLGNFHDILQGNYLTTRIKTPTTPKKDSIGQTVESIRSWYDKNFNMP